MITAYKSTRAAPLCVAQPVLMSSKKRAAQEEKRAKEEEANSDSEEEPKSTKIYTWDAVKNNADLRQRLESVYGLDQVAAKDLGQAPSSMPWSIRDLLGDYLCPNRNPENDLFKPVSTDEQEPDHSSVQKLIKDLATQIRNTYGKSGKHSSLVAAWVKSIAGDLTKAYMDIARRFAQERSIATGVLLTEKLESKKRKVTGKEEHDESSSSSSSESEDEKKPSEKEKASSPKAPPQSPGHDQEKVEDESENNHTVIPAPAPLPPVVQAPLPTINVYRPAPDRKAKKEDDEDLLPAAPPPELFIQDEIESVSLKPNSKLPGDEEMPAAPPPNLFFEEDISVEPKRKQFTVPLAAPPPQGSLTSSWGSGSVSGSSASRVRGKGAPSLQSMYSTYRTVSVHDFEEIKKPLLRAFDTRYDNNEDASSVHNEFEDLAAMEDATPYSKSMRVGSISTAEYGQEEEDEAFTRMLHGRASSVSTTITSSSVRIRDQSRSVVLDEYDESRAEFERMLNGGGSSRAVSVSGSM